MVRPGPIGPLSGVLTMAKSLMEGMDIGPAPAKGAAKGGDRGKLIFAVVLLLVALGVFAWSQGWILAGAGQGPQLSAEEKAQRQQEFTQQQKRSEEQVKKGTAKVGGS
jgi:hypothetical protein